MDLAVWALSANVRTESASRSALLEGEPAELAAAYVAGRCHRPLQSGLTTFPARYGFRAIGEL